MLKYIMIMLMTAAAVLIQTVCAVPVQAGTDRYDTGVFYNKGSNLVFTDRNEFIRDIDPGDVIVQRIELATDSKTEVSYLGSIITGHADDPFWDNILITLSSGGRVLASDTAAELEGKRIYYGRHSSGRPGTVTCRMEFASDENITEKTARSHSFQYQIIVRDDGKEFTAAAGGTAARTGEEFPYAVPAAVMVLSFICAGLICIKKKERKTLRQ